MHSIPEGEGKYLGNADGKTSRQNVADTSVMMGSVCCLTCARPRPRSHPHTHTNTHVSDVFRCISELF
jgi:hypothetical protein